MLFNFCVWLLSFSTRPPPLPRFPHSAATEAMKHHASDSALFTSVALQAAEHLERALDAFGSAGRTRRVLGRVWAMLNRPEAAEQLLKGAHKTIMSSTPCLITLCASSPTDTHADTRDSRSPLPSVQDITQTLRYLITGALEVGADVASRLWYAQYLDTVNRYAEMHAQLEAALLAGTRLCICVRMCVYLVLQPAQSPRIRPACTPV